MLIKRNFAVILLLIGQFATSAALADDGGISFGGSPHLLGGHPNVSMKSESVNMNIGDKLIKVDCKFVFHNAGPATTVRMGFPDEGTGAAEPYQGEALPKKNLKATFITYDSWVDGKKVPTRLVPTDDRTLFWHTKTVTFKANSDCVIRDVYTLPPGAQVTNENGMYQQTSYVLHTGASWKGPIGHGEVLIKFEPNVVQGPIELKERKSLAVPLLGNYKWSTLGANTVVYEGPSQPKVDGNTLRFTFTDLKPSEKDDIHLYYAWRKLTNM